MSFVRKYEEDISFRPIPPIPHQPLELIPPIPRRLQEPIPPRVENANMGWGIGEKHSRPYEELIRLEKEEKIKRFGQEVVKKKAERRLTFKAEEELVEVFEYEIETEDEDFAYFSNPSITTHFTFESDEEFHSELLEFEAAMNLQNDDYLYFNTEDRNNNESFNDVAEDIGYESPPPQYRRLRFITDDNERLENELKAHFDIPISPKDTEYSNPAQIVQDVKYENGKWFELSVREASSNESFPEIDLSSDVSSDKLQIQTSPSTVRKIPEGPNPEIQNFLTEIISEMRNKELNATSSNQSLDIGTIPPPSSFSDDNYNEIQNGEKELTETISPLSISIQKNLTEFTNSTKPIDEPNNNYLNDKPSKETSVNNLNKANSKNPIKDEAEKKINDKVKKKKKHPYEQNKWAILPTKDPQPTSRSAKPESIKIKNLNFTVTGTSLNKLKKTISTDSNSNFNPNSISNSNKDGGKRQVKEPFRWRDVQLPKYEGQGSAYGMSPELKKKVKEEQKKEKLEKLKKEMIIEEDEGTKVKKGLTYNAWLAKKKREERFSNRVILAVPVPSLPGSTFHPFTSDFGRYEETLLGDPKKRVGIVKELSSMIGRNAALFNIYKAQRLLSMRNKAESEVKQKDKK